VAALMLNVEAVELSFRGVRALAGVSLDLHEGEVLGIIGPNGSGKSTLFNVITGIYRPDRGTVRFRDQPIAGLNPRAIVGRGIARTYQNKRLFASLSVLENVLVPALRREKGGLASDMLGLPIARKGWLAAHARAASCLEFVGLAAVAGVSAGSLAYGQQNRLELARALALEPALLLLDEPAAGLTQDERSEMRGLIERIRDRGVSIALVEHDMRVVMGLCSRIVVLDHGEVIAAGAPAEIARNPAVIAAYLGEPVDG
jgi:ABC-type branched-subunit amino acid transport system ATPase component